MIAKVLNACWTFLQRMFNRAFEFFGELLGYLFNKLFSFLRWLLQPVFILLGIIFYFLYKVGVLAVLLLKVFLGVGTLFVAFVKGIFITLAGFSFTPTARSDGKWTSIFHNVTGGLDFFQLDTVAYILMFCIWFGTGFAAIKILSSAGTAGGE